MFDGRFGLQSRAMHQFSLPLLLGLGSVAVCQAPPGYYNSVDTSSAAALRASLHDVIDDHVEFPYTAGSTDTWDILEDAMEDPSNSNRIVDIYRNVSYQKQGGGNSNYNREHSWPRSYGFPDGDDWGPFTDCHHLFLCNDSYNTSRSNKPFDNCAGNHTERTTAFTNGTGGGSGVYPGNSNWTDGSFTSGAWEVWNSRKGDIARAQLYMAVRYEGGMHGVTGRDEPNLLLTDDRNLIDSSNTGSNESVAYMGLLSVLLQWHLDDPVTQEEIDRNDVVFSYQQNRNPFVDHPEWVGIVWGLTQPGSATPFGAGCRAVGFAPVLSVPQTPTIGQPISYRMALGPANQLAAFHLGLSATSLDLGVLGFVGCTLYTTPVGTVPGTTDVFGFVEWTTPVPNDPPLIGVHVFGQWLAVDTAFGSIAVTNGIDVEFGN